MKKYIKKKIAKRICAYFIKNYQLKDGNKKQYRILRWIVDLVADEYESSLNLFKVALYLDTNNVKTQFTDVFTVDNTVFILTMFPGMWIGTGGSISREIENTINTNAKGEKTRNYEVRPIEDLSSATQQIYSNLKQFKNLRDFGE